MELSYGMSEEERKAKQEEATEKENLVFCKLEGECIAEKDPPYEPHVINDLFEIATHSKLAEEILDIDYDGVDFLGEEFYRNSPYSRIGQTKASRNTISYKKDWTRYTKLSVERGPIQIVVCEVPKFSVVIDTNKTKIFSSREDLLKIDSLCDDIRRILIKDNGSKKE